MLSVPAEFPHAGSQAYLRQTARPVRIQRRNDDGTALVIRTDVPRGYAAASAVFTAQPDDLFATRNEALMVAAKPRRRRKRGARK